MLTNPNTLGLFEEDIVEIAAAVHEVGGLLYYDGANLNAILGHGAARATWASTSCTSTCTRPSPPPTAAGGRGPGRWPCRERLVPLPPRSPPGACSSRREASSALRLGRPRTLDRPGPRLARQRPGAGPGPRLHPASTAATACAGWPSAAVLNANWLRSGCGHVRRPLRPAVHARVVLSAAVAQAAQRREGPRRGQAPHGGGLPLPRRSTSRSSSTRRSWSSRPRPRASRPWRPWPTPWSGSPNGRARRRGRERGSRRPHATPVRRVDEARAARRLCPT